MVGVEVTNPHVGGCRGSGRVYENGDDVTRGARMEPNVVTSTDRCVVTRAPRAEPKEVIRRQRGFLR